MDDKNNLIVLKNLIQSGLSPLEISYLIRILDALPALYRKSLTNNTHDSRNAFVLADYFELRLNNQNVALCKALSKAPFIWRKVVPGRRVTRLPELPWATQLFLHFLTKLGEPFT